MEHFLSAVMARTAALGLDGSELRLTLGAAAKLGVFATLETRRALRESVLELARSCADGSTCLLTRGLKNFFNEVLERWKVEPIPEGVHEAMASRGGSSLPSAAQLKCLLASPSSVAELFALGAHMGAFDGPHTHLALGMLRQLMAREAAPLGAVACLSLKAMGERFVGAVLARTAQLALAGEIEEGDMVRLCSPSPQP